VRGAIDTLYKKQCLVERLPDNAYLLVGNSVDSVNADGQVNVFLEKQGDLREKLAGFERISK
jgi:hypothetical protein